VLIAKPGLDGHDVGAKVICRALTDAGMDVTYTGLRQSPASIAESVATLRPDVLGLSVLSGAHDLLCRKVAAALREAGVDDVLWMVGGVVPERDVATLREIGVDGVFATGSSFDDVVAFIRENVTR
jgi:methylmalonyl-CoA mutase C-terminal domain/subunit